jgi:hypothetical protein
MDIKEIERKINETYEQSYQVSRSASNRASNIGHPCLRFLYFERVCPEKKSLPSVEQIKIFSLGDVYETIARSEIEKAGYKILHYQFPLVNQEYQITGTIDFKILLDGKAFVCEIKSLSPFNWQAINQVEDIKNSDIVYIRNYYYQMQTYLWLTDNDRGILILKNKSNNQNKILLIQKDEQVIEEVKEKAKKINEYVSKNETPPLCNDIDVCYQCPYFLQCKPDIISQFKLRIERGFITKIKEWMQAKKVYDEKKERFERLDKELKERVKMTYQPNEIVCVGEQFIITQKEIIRKAYTVPESKFIKVDIKPLNKNE